MIVLYESADTKGPVVGTISKESLIKHDSIIELPRSSCPGSEGEPIRERLENDVNLSNSCFRFSFDVGQGKETLRETFERRISKAVEVRSLDSMGFGWKLVRLGPDQPQRRGVSRKVREVGEASDGKEVVAAWSEKL